MPPQITEVFLNKVIDINVFKITLNNYNKIISQDIFMTSKTDKDGTYKISLKPGNYMLCTRLGIPYGNSCSKVIKVRASKFLEVKIFPVFIMYQ